LTVFTICVFGSSNFETTFLPDCTKFFSVFSGYRVGNLMRISKMCLKQSLSYFKRVLPAIFPLIVLSNCVPSSSNFNTAFLPDCTVSFVVFFRLLDSKFNEDSKNVLKSVIVSLQVAFRGDFVLDYLYNLCFSQFKL